MQRGGQRSRAVLAATASRIGSIAASWACSASMPIAIIQNINFPSVTVSTPYPGADPATVESAVTTPIENQLATVQNIDTNGLTSTSLQGLSIVQVQFTPNADPNTISVDVQRVVNAVRNQLPPDPNVVPSIVRQDHNAISVVTVAFTGSQPLASSCATVG